MTLAARKNRATCTATRTSIALSAAIKSDAPVKNDEGKVPYYLSTIHFDIDGLDERHIESKGKTGNKYEARGKRVRN